MPLIGVLNSMVDGTFVTAAPHNANYDAIKTAFNASAVLTDVVKTITVSHNWNAPQNFAGGITANITGNVTGNVTGNLTGNVTGNLTGTILTASQPNITTVGTLAALTVTGAFAAGSSTITGALVAGSFTVPTAAQPNITSLGLLTSLGVSGDAAFGTGHIRPGVSTPVTGATTIYSPSGPFGLVYVYGTDGAGKLFFDIVLHIGFTAPQVLHSMTLGGAPAVRTYTAPGSTLQLAMAAGTYTVKTMPFEVN